jgi:hypothetical protein
MNFKCPQTPFVEETVSQFVMPAKAGIQCVKKLNDIPAWIPACAGMTTLFLVMTEP